MKYKAKEYAQAIVGAKKFDPKIFLRLLEKNGDLKNAKAIIAELEKMNQKQLVVEVARNMKPILPGAKQKINPELIAGVRVTVNGERQLDFSLKKKLEKIFNV